MIVVKDESEGVNGDQGGDGGDDQQSTGSGPSQGLHRNFSFEQKVRFMKVRLTH